MGAKAVAAHIARTDDPVFRQSILSSLDDKDPLARKAAVLNELASSFADRHDLPRGVPRASEHGRGRFPPSLGPLPLYLLWAAPFCALFAIELSLLFTLGGESLLNCRAEP